MQFWGGLRALAWTQRSFPWPVPGQDGSIFEDFDLFAVFAWINGAGAALGQNM